jgi:hypothetical protein
MRSPFPGMDPYLEQCTTWFQRTPGTKLPVEDSFNLD